MTLGDMSLIEVMIISVPAALAIVLIVALAIHGERR